MSGGCVVLGGLLVLVAVVATVVGKNRHNKALKCSLIIIKRFSILLIHIIKIIAQMIKNPALKRS